MLPSVPEIMGDQFRTAVSGKDAFPVAVCAHTALQGGIIGEVPCLFPDKKVSSVEGLAVHFIKFCLKFFTPHFRRTVMEPARVSAPYSVIITGFPIFSQKSSSRFQA